MIERTNRRQLPEIVALGKQRIESLQIGIVWVLIATGDICLEAESRLQRPRAKRITNIGSDGPGVNIAVANAVEGAELVNGFDVVIQSVCRTPKTCAERLARLATNALIKARFLFIEPEIIDIDIAFQRQSNVTGFLNLLENRHRPVAAF